MGNGTGGGGEDVAGDIAEHKDSDLGADFGTNGTSVTRACSTGSHSSTSSAALLKRRKNSASV